MGGQSCVVECSWEFSHKTALVTCSCATVQARAKRRPRVWHAAFCLQIFVWHGSCDMSMCISTALARANCTSRLVLDIFPVNSCIKRLLWYAHVHFDCARWYKVILMKSSKRSRGNPGDVLSCTGPYDKILCRSCWNPLRGPCLILHRSLWEDLAKILLNPPKRSLHDLVPALVRGSCGDHVHILLKGPCIKILKMLCIRGACMEVLLGCS